LRRKHRPRIELDVALRDLTDCEVVSANAHAKTPSRIALGSQAGADEGNVSKEIANGIGVNCLRPVYVGVVDGRIVRGIRAERFGTQGRQVMDPRKWNRSGQQHY
jgi:hypothetical protein